MRRFMAVVVACLGACDDAGSSSSMTSTGMASTGASGSDGAGLESESESESTSFPSTTGASTGVDAGTSGDDTGSAGSRGSSGSGEGVLPPPGVLIDYQLGGAYDAPAGVELVFRDRLAAPARGLYNVCYVNGYQTQPNEQQWWLDEHPDLLLRDGEGEPIIDPDWDEILLDITTEEKRLQLAEVVGGWIEQCAADGFDAVEIDNLDTYSRSDGMISQDDAVAYMMLLSESAHDSGMPIAQKNSAEIVDRAAEMGTDFAVAEECNRWDECGVYQSVYGDSVFIIEYRDQDFEQGCVDYPALSLVRRDLNLVVPSDPAYVYATCE